MRRLRVEMIYHVRCAECASAYRNLGRAIWRLQRSVKVDVGLLPAATPAECMQERDFALHCLIQNMQRTGGEHATLQNLLDSMVDDGSTIYNREKLDTLDVTIGIDATAERCITAESASATRQALERVGRLDPLHVPAFLIDDEHLLHGNASPAFLHDVLRTLAEPPRLTTRTLLRGLSRWTS